MGWQGQEWQIVPRLSSIGSYDSLSLTLCDEKRHYDVYQFFKLGPKGTNIEHRIPIGSLNSNL